MHTAEALKVMAPFFLMALIGLPVAWLALKVNDKSDGFFGYMFFLIFAVVGGMGLIVSVLGIIALVSMVLFGTPS